MRGCALDPLALERALTLLRTRFAEPLGVGDLADEAGYSRHHFGRGFTRDVGVAPGEYLAALRFAEAKRLLLGGGDAVLDVAVAVGFSSPSTFTRRFRAAVGTTPGGLRRVADSVAAGTLPEFSLGDPARPRIRVRLRRPGGPPARPCRTWIGWYPRPVAVGLPAGGVLTRSDEAELPLCPGAPWLLAFTLDDAADPADELAPGRPVVGGHPAPLPGREPIPAPLVIDLAPAHAAAVPLLSALPCLAHRDRAAPGPRMRTIGHTPGAAGS